MELFPFYQLFLRDTYVYVALHHDGRVIQRFRDSETSVFRRLGPVLELLRGLTPYIFRRSELPGPAKKTCRGASITPDFLHFCYIGGAKLRPQFFVCYLILLG